MVNFHDCHLYGEKRGGSRRYSEGHRYCATCEYAFKGHKYCPCCGQQLRGKPKHEWMR